MAGLIAMYIIGACGWVWVWAVFLAEWGERYRPHRKRNRRFAASMILLCPLWLPIGLTMGAGTVLYWVVRLLAIVLGHDKKVVRGYE